MKYIRLSKEQLEELQPEFTRFLATQSITADEWAKLKEEKPEVAEAELDVFSDLVWEGALSKATHLENASKDQLFCIAIEEQQLRVIHIRSNNPEVDLLTQEGRSQLLKDLKADWVEIQTGTKPITSDRNLEVFGLIQQGAGIVNGEFYKAISENIKY